MMSTRCAYPTDVSEAQWEVPQLLLPTPTWRPGGPGRQPLDRRRVLNGLFDVNKTGGQWRMRPTDFGNGQTIYGSVRRGRQAGVWGRVMDPLRRGERQSQGRLPAPSAGCAESQRIKTATPDEDVGLDGNKKITGRKRHILGDILGLIVAVGVTAAQTAARHGLGTLVQGYGASGGKRLRTLGGDAGDAAPWLAAGGRSLKQTHQIDLEVVKHRGTGFQGVKHRWKVERPCAWLVNDRRHRRDYARLTVSSAAMSQMSMIRILLKRLA